MDEKQVRQSRRRSRREVEQLVAEYETSGLGRTEFCRTHGLSLSTLNRYRKRRPAHREPAGAGALVAVELSGTTLGTGGSGTAGLSVILSGGRRIEVARGFDPETLDRLVERLECA